MLRHPILALSLPVRSFLDPNNYLLTIAGKYNNFIVWFTVNHFYLYIQNIINVVRFFLEQALQTMSIALRGDGQFELKGPLADIGWRIRKHYFLVSYGINCYKHF